MGESKQHVQVPNNMTADEKLSPKDLLIYASIKRYMNAVTLEAFPSYETIMKHSGASKPTIQKSLENLVRLGYLSISKRGRSNLYKFNKHKKFEPFSYDFLDKEDLTANEKGFIIAAQQYMYKDIEGYGKISMSDTQLASMLNMSYNTVRKYSADLRDKGYLTVAKTEKKDMISGVVFDEKLFHLSELGQKIVFTLQKHEDQIAENTNDIKTLQKQIEILTKELHRQHLKDKEDNNLEIIL